MLNSNLKNIKKKQNIIIDKSISIEVGLLHNNIIAIKLEVGKEGMIIAMTDEGAKNLIEDLSRALKVEKQQNELN